MLSDNICSSDMSEVSEFTLTKKMAKHMYVLFERDTWNSKTHEVKALKSGVSGILQKRAGLSYYTEKKLWN